jgi:membrane protease subunit HflK
MLDHKTRKFPIVLLIAATIFLYFLSADASGVIIFRLAELVFTMALFLVLAAVFYEIKKIEFKIPVKIKSLFRKLHKADTVDTAPAALAAPVASVSDGLIEIPKEAVSGTPHTKTNLFLRIAEIAYIVSFCGIAFWRVFAMIKSFPFSLTEYYRYSIVVAVLLLVFPCAALIYLNMRKGAELHPGDKTSRDMLMLFAYASFIFSAVIAAYAVLKLNILGVLPWVYCAALVYLIIKLALNIIFSIFKEVRQDFSLKSLYTIQYAVKILPGVLLGLGFALFLSTTVFVVQPHQQALVYRLGTPSPVAEEGIHVKFPWPIDKVDIYDVRRVNSMQIGYASPYSAHYLWTRAHDGGENMLLTGNGNELVAVNIKIMYTITDLYSYVKNCTNPEAVLSAAAYTALMLRTVDTTLDEFLSVDRNSLSVSVADELSAFCAENRLGLSVLQVIVESIHPPVDIADIYQRVVTAIVVKNTIITRAETTAEKRIIDAQQTSKTAIDNAVARRHNRISEAQQELAVHYAAMEAYAINPASLEIRKYLDTYEKIITGNKVYVFSPGMEASIAKSIVGNANVVGLNME